MLGLPARLHPRSAAAAPTEERQTALEADAEADRTRLVEALRATKWNLSRAAALLGVPRNTLRYRMEKLGLGQRSASSRPAVGSPDAAVPTDTLPPPGLRWEPRRIALLGARFSVGPGVPGSMEASRAMDIVLDKVRSFGGKVAELGTTGVVAAFGLEPLEDAPRRAAYAALAIHRVVTTRGDMPTVQAPVLALHTERLPVARLGDSLEIDADARRRAQSILDALADRADPGTTMVSAPATALLARHFELVPAGSAAGMPGGAHRLTGAIEARRDAGRFVGRAAELELLAERFERARGGQGQVLCVVGEPGIGKSRLLREFRRRSETVASRATWLEGQTMPFGRPMPFHPFVDLLRRTCGIVEGDEEAAAAERLHAYVLGFGDDLRPTLPFLRDLLALDPGDPAMSAMDPNLRRAGILDAIRRLLLRAAERGPEILVFEDVHWADPTTLELLADLADGLAARSVLMILTARPGHPLPIGEGSFHTRLPLSSLSASDSIEVARRLLGTEGLPEELETLIARSVAGNPFYVEEMVRMLQDLGMLQRTVDGWRLVEPPERIALPDTIQEVVLVRVDRLKAAARRVIEVASVIGADVSLSLLESVADLSGDPLREGLQDLRAAELLYEVGTAPGQDYTFKHAVIREVVYGQVPAPRRRELHARLLDAIERTYAERLGEHLDRLVHHASRGERWEQVLTYAQRAAERARAQSAYREMAAFLEQGVTALEHLPQTVPTIERAVDLRFGLRDAYNALQEPDRVVQWLGEAETLAGTLSDAFRLARAASYMSQYFWVEGKPAQAIEVGQRALDSAVALRDLGLEVATGFYLGRAHHAVGDYDRAIQRFSRNVTLLEGGLAHHRFGVSGSPSVLSRIWLAWSYAERGSFANAITCGDEALQIAIDGDDPFTRVGAPLGSARGHLRRGDGNRAIADLEQSLELARAWDIPVWVPIVSAELGAARALAGQLPEAIRLLEQALATSWKVDVSLWTCWLGEAHLAAGRVDEAGRYALRALELSRAHGERGNEAHVRRLQGEIASAREETAAESADHYRQSLALADELGMRPLVAHCHLGLGRLHRRHGARELAERHLAAAAAMRDELGMVRST
jgi:tetratricopeptide (TPR) repeat protein